MLGLVHLGAAMAALVLGLATIARPKGTPAHRMLGGAYAVLLLVVDIAALAIPRGDDGFGPFQVLAVISLVTLGVGIVPMWVLPRTEGVIAVHAITMSFSYVGLVGAGLSQAAAQAFPDSSAMAVVAASLATFAVGTLAIVARVPGAIGALSRSRPEAGDAA